MPEGLIQWAGAGLAPMAGVTDAAMRLLCHEQGAAWAVSEMLSAKGWIFSKGQNRNALDIIRRLPGEGVAGLQLFGSDPYTMAEAAKALSEAGFQFFDINFGCPAPKITGNGEGSAMLKNPAGVAAVVRAVVRATGLPVTVKIRAGWDAGSVNAPEIAHICEDSGARAVTVHARTREQQYSGRADWSVIRAVKAAVRVPVIGNGDVRCGADALRMRAETGCDAVAVGRAAQGNPWVFREIAGALRGEAVPPPTPRERVDMALRHFELERALFGPRCATLQMRRHIAWYVHGMKGATRFRDRVNLIEEGEQVMEALRAFALEQETP